MIRLMSHSRWPGLIGIAVVLYLGALVSAAGLWLCHRLLRVLPARMGFRMPRRVLTQTLSALDTGVRHRHGWC
jgi:hypothetical protein